MNIQEAIKTTCDKVDTNTLLNKPLTEWRPILTEECQVYVLGENYIAKRFDSICYKFCEKEEAKEVLVDNLFALLRYKYFPICNEKVDDRISDIVTSFTKNLKTSLKKVSFDKNSDADIIKMLPDGCVAFRNGVYNFKTNDWLFKYEINLIESLKNKIYVYDKEYAIFWYLDYEFKPFIDITTTSIEECINIMKELTKDKKIYCFELMYNIAHNQQDIFDMNKFKHLCEILGYTCLNSFSQHFIMLIGSGQNGKNSLFDGCFTNRLIPSPAANDLESIENDKFITGALENRTHNIFLESTTVAKTYTESKNIKALTGSMYQTIESKGIQKYSGIINCKYIFAANDQDKLKFGDTTTGFRRRINMFEIAYQWDKYGRYLQHGDYYNTSFNDDLHELKDETLNTDCYVYFAMYGIMLATKNFTKNFEFDYNDWNMSYADVDIDLKHKIDEISIKQVALFMNTSNGKNYCKNAFYDMNKNNLCHSKVAQIYGIYNYEQLVNMMSNPEDYNSFFSENDIYISLRIIQALSASHMSASLFTQSFKKIYNISKFTVLSTNIPFIKCTFINDKLKILK